jgi:hypothetical protein
MPSHVLRFDPQCSTQRLTHQQPVGHIADRKARENALKNASPAST